MNRISLRRADSSRQLDLFSFVPAVLPRREPAPEEAPVVLPFPDRPDPPDPKPPEPTAAVEVPASTPFRILDRHRLGQGSLAQKCRDNLAALALFKRLESEARPATQEERAVLVRYVGWGGLPQVFDERNPNWTSERTELRRLLSDDEFRSARASTLNAHDTAAPVVRAMYAALERFGFAGGRVLEPACGLGHFLGLMPEAMRERSTFTGIEIDGLTTRLARALYPEADLRHSPFEEARLQPDSFDLAISNVPFGDYRPFDPRFPRLLIHDFFFAAALAWVRPGGLIAFITSRGTLDKQDASLRDHVTAQADLLGAIRLPNTPFTENAITEQQREDRGSRIVKELEKAKKRLETKLKELLAEGRKDDGLTFEQWGVDRLFVDEAHHFKNLFYVSKMTRIAGLPQTASQRALDMFLKVRNVQRTPGGGVVFATGTPIANSVAEMFTMQRYLQLTALQELKVDHFDAWAGTFGEPVTAMELSPDGSGYRLNTRFARFINVPELMAQFRQVADIRTAAMLQLPVPALQGGKPTVLSAPCSPELKRIVEGLVQRADRLRTGQAKPNEDNMLLVTSDGRKAALDLRLIDPTLPDLPDSKVNRAVAEVERIWRDTAEQRSVQLVFCDLSIPGPGFSVYTDMRDKLVARGVPPDEIAFIQNFDSDAAKAALFRDVRNGRVRILFGSTAKMGSGTNVQRHLIALHHLDAPWRPADVEQREGRILRQGNQNPEVQIYRYVTAESFDAYMWQCLETKAKFIAQVMSGDTSLRRLEDVDGAALTYAEVKAIASGNPLVIEKANVDAELARLTRLRTQHRETGYRIRNQVRHLSEEIPRLERRLTALDADLARRQDTRGGRFTITLGTQQLTDRGIAGEMLIRVAERSKGLTVERRLGTFAGFDLLIGPLPSGEAELLLRGNATHTCRVQATAHGTTRALEHVVNNLEDIRTQLADHLVQLQRRLGDLRVQMDVPFEHAARLAELEKRQKELVDVLDLSRSVGSSDGPMLSEEGVP